MIHIGNQLQKLIAGKGLRLSILAVIIIFTGLLTITVVHANIITQDNIFEKSLDTDIASQKTMALSLASNNVDTQKVLVGFRNRPGAKERSIVNEHNGKIRFEFPEIQAFAIDIPASRLDALSRNPAVLYIEEDAPRYALGLADSELEPSLTNGLYGLITTNTTDAHALGVNGTGVIVCIADTGLDYNHPDIAPGYLGGIDIIDGDDDPFWNNNTGETHGTHVAGTVMAALNDQGVRGVAYNASLYHARVLGPDGSGSTSGIMAGIRDLVENKECKIVSLSLGGSKSSRAEERFYQDMYDNHGALIIAAAGNDGTDGLLYPAGYPLVLSVGAVDSNNAIAGFSNYGNNLDLMAPGVNVLSSVPYDTGFESRVNTTDSSFFALGMQYAGTTEGITGTIVDCGTGNNLSNFSDDVNGNISLIERGIENFAIKADNAMKMGATAVIIYNNEFGDFSGTLGDTTNSTGVSWIPVVSVSDTTGATLVSKAGTTGTVINMVSDWDHYSGTSMATPHVAGIAGLILSVNSELTNAQVESILKNTAVDLGYSGYDTTYGYGLVNALNAVEAADAGDAHPPFITDVLINHITSKSAVITWNTDEPSNSTVVYNSTTQSEKNSSDMVTAHSITLTGLSSGTKYYFRVESTDGSGNTAIDNNTGYNYIFITKGKKS